MPNPNSTQCIVSDKEYLGKFLPYFKFSRR